MKDYAGSDVMQAGIADKELMGRAIGSLAGYSARHNTALFIGVGNLVDMSWVAE